MHVPRPLHPLGHVATEQSADVHPSTHSHWPSGWQMPWAEQPDGQLRSSHVVPYAPAWHAHVPSMHAPLPWHAGEPGQVRRLQSSPVKPAAHSHWKLTHEPCSGPEQLRGHEPTEQSSPK